MKIVVTAQGPTPTSEVDPRFGRAAQFILADTDSDSYTAHDNAQNVNALQGAGIQAAQQVIELGAEAVITGNVGPKAFAALRAGDVQIFLVSGGSVRDAVAQLTDGELEALDEANVEGHWM